GALQAPLRWCSGRRSVLALRCEVAVDVLVDSAVARAAVAAPGAAREHAALEHVSRRVVLVLGDFPRICALDRVPPVRPDPEREGAEGADVEVVTREGHRAVRELLVVGI